MSTTKPATSRGVSRQLAAAGYTRSVWHASGAVRGFGTATTGFSARQLGSGLVRVDHYGSRGAPEPRDKALETYKATLEGLGYTVEYGSTQNYLEVTR